MIAAAATNSIPGSKKALCGCEGGENFTNILFEGNRKMSLEIEYKNRTNGTGHWFDKETMRFFKSKIGLVRSKGDDYYFVSSEQPPHGPRMFSVRHMDKDGDIKTIGEFCSLTRYMAEKKVRQLSGCDY
tara:strand:+ start:661 stop:1047 length:387 start_codon:yes stop_codon:yes gene_type:complete